ncbi:Aminopeptidase N [Folsomia candida]|uniref:Aminopeptidase N n=2 Tax=Folsomia candida TaxID=158441 RepID=A0A226F579_FOLCA|nr:Aminopeptidase N [Folsomia candida]
MLKFLSLLLLQIGLGIVQCSWFTATDNSPVVSWGSSTTTSSSPYFWDLISPDIEENGKEKISAKRRFSLLKIKDSELFLPRNVVPISYKLKIRPILESDNPEEVLTAPGSVTIIVRCDAVTDTITLHANTKQFVNILRENLLHVQQTGDNTTTSRVNNVSVLRSSLVLGKEDADFYQIQLSENLQPGEQYSLHLDFVTRISNSTLDGLYLSSYEDPSKNEKKFLAVTQFEAIAARQMFPCFDEPDLKATFEIVVSRAKGYTSMSNMPLHYSEPDSENAGYFLDHFPPTPRMSTYLVALVVSEFTCTTAPAFLLANKTVEACGPAHLVAEGGASHAAQVSARILAFYDKLWGVPYPLPKMTSVAIPDFEAGAMENYGLNTYRISALFYFPDKSTESRRLSVESTIAHELAHQNFGNLVTCKTWNQIFLNEGFATYVSKLGVEEVSPEFEGEAFGWYTDYFQRALRADAFPASHPLVKVEDYFGQFDAISYSKGSSLIKMMENILSRKTLVNGLRQYLDKFSFGNAEYRGLFNTLDLQAKAEDTHPELAPLADIMDSWTVQPGFPLVRVTWVSEQLFHISQERFLQQSSTVKDGQVGSKDGAGWRRMSSNPSSTPLNNTRGDDPLLWHCPIFIATAAHPNRTVLVSEEGHSSETTSPHHRRPTMWLTNKESIKAWVPKSKVDWIIVNPDSKAFFRVLYDERLSDAIENQLEDNSQIFSPITRAQLIDDGFENAWAHYSPIQVALGRTRAILRDETDPRVWATALNHFKQIYAMLSENEDSVRDFKKYLSPRVSQAVDAVGVAQGGEERGQSVLHRASLFVWGGVLELPSVLHHSKNLVKLAASESNLNLIPVDIRGEALCAAVIEGDSSTTNFLWDLYSKSKAKSESSVRNILLNAIGCSRNPAMIQRYLDNSSQIGFLHSKSDRVILLQKLVVNPFSRNATFSYLRQHFRELIDYFDGLEVPGKILRTFSYFWNTEERLNQMKELQKEFLEELKLGESLELTLALIQANVDWMQHHGSDIKNWMQTQARDEEQSAP